VTVRLATFNILSGRAPDAAVVDPGRFGAAIAGLDADVLALQEVDRGQPRSGGLDLTALAAEAMGATDHRFAAALAGRPGTWVPATGFEPVDGPAYGIALLSRHPVSAWRVVRLPALPGRVPYLWPGARRPSWVRDEARVALVADLATPIGPLRVAATHLSFLAVSSGRQLRRLLAAVDDADVLAGDLNMRPARAARLTGLRALATGATFPARRPVVQIDHLLARDDRLVASGPRVVALPVSDHRALVVDLSR
jgi:endonuclease/exonuclease/phosphatase family metal-dependent hydrolase